MKKIILALILVFVSTAIFAQSKSDLAGMWKIVTMVGSPKGDNMKPTYFYLNPDGSYVWGVDSTEQNPTTGTVKGTWDLTSDGYIKITPDGDRGTYYSPRGDSYMYDYYGYDKNGKKVPEIVLEMSIYIQKLVTK
jgi:hypothetical protein